MSNTSPIRGSSSALPLASAMTGSDKQCSTPTTREFASVTIQGNADLPPVIVLRHRPDFDDLATAPMKRIVDFADDPFPCMFFNPEVTVVSSAPTPAFFRQVHLSRRHWCGRLKLEVNRRLYGSVKDWPQFTPGASRTDRYFDYALSVTGMVFVDGRPLTRSTRSKAGRKHRPPSTGFSPVETKS